jgi:threonine dehydrogenase-like Zn-dependent dehydrogenase
MNKGLTLRMGQQHGQKYIPRLLEHIRKGELDPSYLLTHRASLAEGQSAYEKFKDKRDGCIRVVFTPEA